MDWHRQNGSNIDQERSLPSQPKARELAADTGAINRRRFHIRSELLPQSQTALVNSGLSDLVRPRAGL
jgi:hypothetical protein